MKWIQKTEKVIKLFSNQNKISNNNNRKNNSNKTSNYKKIWETGFFSKVKIIVKTLNKKAHNQN